MVGGVSVILRLLGYLVVAGGHQSAVHDQHGVLGEPAPRLQGHQRAELTMIRSAADFETPNSGASWRIVKFVRQ